ncbi:MAG: hypothetical protein ACRDD9_23500 [Shewanella sp.]
MFTIEALNRIEGFVWPEGAKFAEVDGGCIAYFYESNSTGSNPITSVRVKDQYDIREIKASVTREQVESVDGWVRNDGKPPVDDGAIVETIVNGEVDSRPFPADGIEWGNGGCVSHWRYPKPQKQEVKPEPESIETMIRQYKYAGENKRAAIDKLNQAQTDVEQAEALEDSLFMAIEAWAESHGFDIRVLSESEEKPELAITDWRDLQAADVIWWSVNRDSNGVECEVVKVANPESKDRLAVYAKSGGKYFWIDVYSEEWKFISRPEKK